jgi:hypothetical protein
LHMLSHVFDVVSAGLFDSTVWELNAFDRENLYRLDKDNSLRLRVSVKVYYPSHIVTGNGCFVASAAYGSPLEPEVQSLRRFRETVLRPTRTGGAFFDRFYRHYDRLSRPIVAAMERDDELRGLFRTALVTPIVRWLELATEFPGAPLDGVPEPWRSFLSDTRRNLEDWGQAIDLPDGFDGLSTEEAVAEIGMILRYVLRTDARRNAYLDRLVARGEIPFHCAGADYTSCVETLRALGRPAHEIARLLEQHQKEV